VPSPWQNWTFWQYDNAGSLPGIGNTDLDYYQPTDGLPALRAPSAAASAKTAGKKHAVATKPKRHMKSKAKAKAKSKSKSAAKHKGEHQKHPKAKGNPKPKKHKARHRSVSSRYPGKG
jgi:hypothetical protein